MARPKNQAQVDLSVPHDLTVGLIERMRCPQGKTQVFLRDQKSPGLAVRATLAGSKAFVFEAKLNRSTFRRTIGDARAWSISEARAESNKLRVTIDNGLDPRELDKQRKAEEQRQRSAELARSVTVGQAWSDYLEERSKSWRERTLLDHRRLASPVIKKGSFAPR
ncbi:MAG: DUF4102 domain-containing protein, partial [Betaproteobacteria bacterium]|nr:DUF4102 domain-containing protein [Betaproteobacteria bacterium]